jgi:hypothetical protein
MPNDIHRVPESIGERVFKDWGKILHLAKHMTSKEIECLVEHETRCSACGHLSVLHYAHIDYWGECNSMYCLVDNCDCEERGWSE